MLDTRPLILQGTAYESFGRKICPILLNQFITVCHTVDYVCSNS